ncbi:MAG: glycosyltransferase [Candidatus Acidiferrales bacterium]
MLTTFYILILAQICLGVISLLDGVLWLRMIRKRLRTHAGFYAPRVALLCPCKGLESGLEENLSSLLRFDYADYEVVFILASALDPARQVIERVMAANQRSARLVIAEPPKDCGEKVINLRKAIDTLGDQVEVIVFTDSDVRPGRSWLAHLVAPLAETRIGATTTFRWLFPAKGGFASALASAWNAAIVTLLGDHSRNFCWGGGTAIRRKVFEEIHALDSWQGAVSDDFALTRALHAANLAIHFVPECLASTAFDASFRELLAFTDRQIIITRVYSPRHWAAGLISHVSYAATLLFGVWVVLAEILAGEAWLGLAILWLLVPLLAAMKGTLRMAAVGEILPEWRTQIAKWSWAWTALAPLVPFLYAWNTLAASVRREIRWRGVRYRLISANETRVLSR